MVQYTKEILNIFSATDRVSFPSDKLVLFLFFFWGTRIEWDFVDTASLF